MLFDNLNSFWFVPVKKTIVIWFAVVKSAIEELKRALEPKTK